MGTSVTLGATCRGGGDTEGRSEEDAPRLSPVGPVRHDPTWQTSGRALQRGSDRWPVAWLMACPRGEATAETPIKDIWRLRVGSQALSRQRDPGAPSRQMERDPCSQHNGPGQASSSLASHQDTAQHLCPGRRPTPAQGSLSRTALRMGFLPMLEYRPRCPSWGPKIHP